MHKPNVHRVVITVRRNEGLWAAEEDGVFFGASLEKDIAKARRPSGRENICGGARPARSEFPASTASRSEARQGPNENRPKENEAQTKTGRRTRRPVPLRTRGPVNSVGA